MTRTSGRQRAGEHVVPLVKAPMRRLDAARRLEAALLVRLHPRDACPPSTGARRNDLGTARRRRAAARRGRNFLLLLLFEELVSVPSA